jgi:hypothetical protein
MLDFEGDPDDEGVPPPQNAICLPESGNFLKIPKKWPGLRDFNEIIGQDSKWRQKAKIVVPERHALAVVVRVSVALRLQVLHLVRKGVKCAYAG